MSNIHDASDINSVHNSDYDASSDSDVSRDSNISISNDINALIDSCHELHANVIVANNLLGNITDKINNIQTINVIYNGEKMDFYDLLELLHIEALKDIEGGRPSRFEEALIDSINNSVFHKN